MSGGINKAIVLGNLGADPEIRRTDRGTAVASFSVATTESWRDQSGEKRERTEWHRVVVFNENLVKIVEQYLKKGSKVYIEGQMATRKWKDRDGIERYTTEVVLRSFHATIVLLDGRGDGAGGRPPPPAGEDDYGTSRSASPGGQRPAAQPARADLDDEIPF